MSIVVNPAFYQGKWTPVINSGADDWVLSASHGHYFVSEGYVHFNFSATWSSKNGTGNVKCLLPFLPQFEDGNEEFSFSMGLVDGLSFAGFDQVVIHTSSAHNDQYAYLHGLKNAATNVHVIGSDFSATGLLNFSGNFFNARGY